MPGPNPGIRATQQASMQSMRANQQASMQAMRANQQSMQAMRTNQRHMNQTYQRHQYASTSSSGGCVGAIVGLLMVAAFLVVFVYVATQIVK